MSQVPLRDYLERMRARLREGQYADVITLGQHVLRYYPKHIETYRLLAEARLETNDPIAAVDLFQRVRSADPENIVALVGLSIVHEQRQQLEEAIWHLERAFEIQPANGELRKELLRLYAEFEGTPRERLKLTPGGLARLYTRQGLYSQAIQEFRGLLRRDPTRADIQAALAETLYRVGRKQEAAEVAQSLLEKLPYCLKANLLLGSLWSENGVPEAEALLQRAQSLDPEYTVARDLVPDHWGELPPPMLPAVTEEATAPAPPITPAVPKLDESAARELFCSRASLPLFAPAAKTEAPPAPAVMAQVAAPPLETTEQKPAPTLAPVETPPQSNVAAEPRPVPRIKPALPRIGPTIPGAADKLPAWLRGTAPPATQSAMSAPLTGTGGAAPPAADRSTAARSPRVDKTQPVSRAAPPVKPAPQSAEAAAELPEWLTRARQAARSGEVEENIAATSALGEKPAWLTEANAESPTTESETATPEWLRADSTGASSDQARAEPEGTLPAWLSASEPEDQAEAPASGVVLPDWLSSPQQEAGPAAAETGTSVPAWLQSTEPEARAESPAPSTPAPELPQAPLSGESQPPAALPEAEAPTVQAAPEVETDETIPEWLLELTAATEAEPDVSGTLTAQPGEPVTAVAPTAAPEPDLSVHATVAAPGEPARVEAPTAAPEPDLSVHATAAAPSEPVSVEPIVSPPEPALEVQPVRPEPSAPIAEAAAPAPAEEKPETGPEPLLAQAHGEWTGGNHAGAIELYEKVLQKGPRFTTEVIADFEQFVQEPDAPMPAHRLLGDAYSMVGRFKEALEQYRIVLGR